MEKLTDAFSRYVRGQVRAGADVIQLFDSWVGALSPADYEEFVAPYSARILAAVDCPTIHFGTGTATLLEQMRDAGGDVIGLDWRIPLDWGWEVVGDDRGVQGNLDGAILLGPWERVEAATLDVLARAAGRPGHIFNLGHGVMPDTDPDVLGRLRAFVHEQRPRASSSAGMSSVAVVLMAYGSPEPARGRARLLRRHPRRPADQAGAPRRSRRALPAARDRGVEPAERDHRGDARRARGRARPARLHRHAPLDAADRRGGRAGARGRRDRDRRPRARAALLARCRSRSTGRSSRTRSAAAPSSASSSAGATSRASSRCSRRGSRPRSTSTSSSPRTRCRHGSSTRAIPTGTSCSRRRASWRRRAGVDDWSFSFQSESPTGEPWLGPDILDHLVELAARGVSDVLVCPVGFVADHLEIRWDLDIEAAEKAQELGLRLERIELPNADPAFVRTLAGLVRRAAAVPSAGVKTGQIRVEGVSRRFRVRANEARSLKELFVLARPHRGERRARAPGRLARGRARRGGRARRPQRLRQVDAAAPDRRDHQADRGPRRGRRPGRLAARARRRLPPRLHRPRERLPQRRDLRAAPRADPRALRRDRRLRRARAGDRPPRAHVLVGDVHAARLRDRGAPRRGRAPARRGVRGRRRGVPAQVLRQGVRVQAARRHDRLRLARRVAGRAALRARRAAAGGPARVRRPDPRGDRALPAGRSPPSADPAERAAGLREWGTGEATIVGGAARRGRGRGAAAVPRRRAVLAPAPDRGRERDRAAAAPARAARRGRPARRLGRARHGQRRLGRRHAGAALRRRPAAALGRSLPPPARPRRRRGGELLALARRRARRSRLPGGRGARRRR